MPSEEKAKPEAMDTGHTDEKQGNGTEETQVDDSELVRYSNLLFFF